MKNAREVIGLAMAAVAPKELNTTFLKLVRQNVYLEVREQHQRLHLNRFKEWLDKKCDGE